MFIPAKFQQNDTDEIKEFIRQYAFGILVSQTQGKLWGTHIPLLLSEDSKKLYGHVSVANKQWKDIHSSEVLAIFSGPHTYISSSWYDHENVPTWNYMAVHVYGTARRIEGEELVHSIRQLVDVYEKNSENPVSLDTMSPAYVAKAIKGLVGFEIHIDRMEAAYKLSQNRDEKNHQAIIEQLQKRTDHDSHQVAKAMQATCPHHKTN